MYPNMPGQSETDDMRAPASMTGVDPANETPETAGSTASVEDARVSEEAPAAEPTTSEPLSEDTSTSVAPSASDEASIEAVSEDAVSASDVDSGAGERSSAAAVPEPAVEASGTAKRFKRGDVIEGKVKSTSPTSVIIDLDGEHEGFIPTSELERMSKRALEELTEGASVTVYVVNPRDHNGNIVLSVNRAMEEMDWQRAEEFRQNQQVYESRVAGYNKGGLIVRFGRLRGFVPQSQMSAERRRVLEGDVPEERWSAMVNEPIVVKVVEVDRQRNRLILSERSASRESREKRKESLIQQLTVGEIRTGRVVSLEDFGAFVDIGGAEGLVHLTEMSWQHITHPREMLQVGQEVKVEVISVDPNAKRIGLSMKRQAPDPWDTIALGFQVGQLVQGMVTKLTKFGAFAQLVDVPEIEGLIHISELSDKRVTHPREVVKEGDRLTLRVVKIDVKNRRLGLSLKKVISAEYLDSDWTEPQ